MIDTLSGGLPSLPDIPDLPDPSALLGLLFDAQQAQAARPSRPAYKLTIGATTVDSAAGPGAPLVSLGVETAVDVPADRLTVTLGNVPGLVVSKGARVSLELGYAAGEFHKAFGGQVAAVEVAVDGLRVEALGPMTRLLDLRLHQVYQKQTAGAIVADLAGRAGLPVGQVQDGIGFPAYVVDDSRSGYGHARALAQKCGFDLYLDAEGKLVFKRFTEGAGVHTFEYGANIITLNVARGEPAYRCVQVWGDSPASAQGDAATHWLTKTPQDFKGQAGAGQPLLLVKDRSIRTKAAAEACAQARLWEIERRTLTGTLTVLGAPQVHLGDAVKIAGAPGDGMNGTFQVRRLHHWLSRTAGFVTTIDWMSL